MKILAVLHFELFADILTSLFEGVVATLSISKALSEWGSSAILTWFLIARYDTSVEKYRELAINVGSTNLCYPKSAAFLTEILMKKFVWKKGDDHRIIKYLVWNVESIG